MWPNGVDRLGDTDDRLLTFKQAFVQLAARVRLLRRAAEDAGVQGRYAAVRPRLDRRRPRRHRRMGRPAAHDADCHRDPLARRADHGALPAARSEAGTATPRALLLVCEPTSRPPRRRARRLGSQRDRPDGHAAAQGAGRGRHRHRRPVVGSRLGQGRQAHRLRHGQRPDLGRGAAAARRLPHPDQPAPLPRRRTPSSACPASSSAANSRPRRSPRRSAPRSARSVELLVQAFSEARLAAAKAGDPDPLTEKPDDVYQAAVTVMMRIVFLLFAEEREMLPTEQLYWDSYAISDLLDDLRGQAAERRGAPRRVLRRVAPPARGQPGPSRRRQLRRDADAGLRRIAARPRALPLAARHRRPRAPAARCPTG